MNSDKTVEFHGRVVLADKGVQGQLNWLKSIIAWKV